MCLKIEIEDRKDLYVRFEEFVLCLYAFPFAGCYVIMRRIQNGSIFIGSTLNPTLYRNRRAIYLLKVFVSRDVSFTNQQTVTGGGVRWDREG